MKTLISTLLCLFTFLFNGNTQLLYSTTSAGGKYGGGTICTYNATTQTLNAVKSFSIDGSSPSGSLTPTTDGKFYGMTTGGGAYGYGSIFSYDAKTGIYTQAISFDFTHGDNPSGSLLQANDGKLYGLTYFGGINNAGVIFSFDPATSTITKLYDFNYTNGGNPTGSLMQASDGKLYGTTTAGGSQSRGVIFSFAPPTSTYTDLYDFVSSDGNPSGSLLQANDGKLYGTTTAAFNGNAYGTIFAFDLSTAAYTKLHDFDNTTGATPIGGLMQAANGKLYGATTNGGSNNYGVLFSFDPAATIYTKLHDFDYTSGVSPNSGLIQAADGNLYGTAAYGGSLEGINKGVIFSYNPATSTYTNVYNFDDTNGANPCGGFIQAPDGKLYALTSSGGNANGGVIFSYDIAADAYNKLKDFSTNQDGSTLYGSLFKASDGKLYGMTAYGGAYGRGIIFSYNPLTDVFTKLIDFDYTNGANPSGSLIQASDGKLYGMANNGGEHGYGVIFSYNLTTSTYTKLYDFGGYDGVHPASSLLQASDGKLYGMTTEGGENGGFCCGEDGYGVIFSYDIATSTYAKVYDFDGKNGAWPTGCLLQTADGIMYGVTGSGGIGSFPEDVDTYGVMFSYNPSTSTLTNLHNFDRGKPRVNGANPVGDLIQAADGNLYGMTTSGGHGDSGVIFSYSLSTALYSTLFKFGSANGAHPAESLLQASDGKLYGLTSRGGSKDSGVVFSYNPGDTTSYKKLADFTSANGALPRASFIEVSCTPKFFYKDADGDGYGNPDSTIQSCTSPTGYASDSTDCNDQDSTIHPNAPELCDGIDNNCNGQIDEQCSVPRINIHDAIILEGNSSNKKMNFRVNLIGESLNTITVHYTTVNGTAKAPGDFKATTGTLTFMPGIKEQTITVLVKGDRQTEYPELFKVQLSNAVNATIRNGVGVGIILDDDLRLSNDKLAAEVNTPADRSIVAAPNPATSVINVRLSGYGGNITLQLTSLQGKPLKEVKLKGSTIQQQLNVADIASGTYLLTVTDEDGYKQTIKLLIAR